MLSKYMDLNQSLDLLDIGGYSGVLKNFLPPKIRYYLVDRDKKAVEVARKRNAHKAEVLDLDKQSIEGLFNIKFDIIVIADILDLILDPINLMEQIKNMLKDKGVLIISVTNDNTIYHRFRVLLGKGINKSPFNKFYHLRHPTIIQSKYFLNEYFEVKDRKPWICFDRELNNILDNLAMFLAHLFPGLFARGAIFVCTPKGKALS